MTARGYLSCGHRDMVCVLLDGHDLGTHLHLDRLVAVQPGSQELLEGGLVEQVVRVPSVELIVGPLVYSDRLSVSAVECAALPYTGFREYVAGDLGLLENAHDVRVEVDGARQFEDVSCTFEDGRRQACGAGQIAGHGPDRPAADDDQVSQMNRAIRE